jgi:ABC-type antimicrobial peptide transport system permease subunit
MTILLKTGGNPSALTGAMRAALREIDPRLPVTESRPLSRSLADAMARTSFTVTMLGIAAVMALFLGAVGLYGVISYIVSQRTQEIGVRIALGAPAGDVRGMVVRRGMALAGVGIVVGLVGAFALSSVLATLLYEVSATDPWTYAGVAIVLAFTALVASWLPARRAAAVDPVVALRGE